MQERLIDPDEKNEKFVNYFFDCLGRNTIQKILHPIDTLRVLSIKPHTLEHDLSFFISCFTKIEEVTEDALKEILEHVIYKRHPEIKTIQYKDRSGCIILFNDGRAIPVTTLSIACPNIGELLKDLETSDRDGKCHARSLTISKMISYPETECVTGNIWTFMKGSEWLHSWVETKLNNETYCIDNNINAVLPKNDYYFLFHSTEINRIAKNRIIKESEEILKLNDKSCKATPYLKLYCVNPDEAIEKYYEIVTKEESQER